MSKPEGEFRHITDQELGTTGKLLLNENIGFKKEISSLKKSIKYYQTELEKYRNKSWYEKWWGQILIGLFVLIAGSIFLKMVGVI